MISSSSHCKCLLNKSCSNVLSYNHFLDGCMSPVKYFPLAKRQPEPPGMLQNHLVQCKRQRQFWVRLWEQNRRIRNGPLREGFALFPFCRTNLFRGWLPVGQWHLNRPDCDGQIHAFHHRFKMMGVDKRVVLCCFGLCGVVVRYFFYQVRRVKMTSVSHDGCQVGQLKRSRSNFSLAYG